MKFNQEYMQFNAAAQKTEMPMNNQEETKQSAEKKGDNIVYIEMDRIRPNSKNKYEMTEIEEMAGMIKLAGGILQNLIVKPKDEEGYYTLTTGERRWRGACLLRDQGEYPEKYHGTVPCVIQDPVEIELPLNAEDKEDFAILVTNQYRVKTDAMLYMEMMQWKRIISNLKKAGVKYLPKGMSGDEEVELKGKRIREIVAEQMNLSIGQIARFEKVEKHGSDEVINKLIKNELNLSEAEELAKLETEEQKEVLQKADSGDIKEEVKKKLEKKEAKIQVHKAGIEKKITDALNGVGEMIFLREKEYKKLEKLLKAFEEIMKGDGK